MGENKRVRIGTTALGIGSLVWAILFFWKGLRVCLLLGSSSLFASLSPDSFATVPSNISLLCFIPYVLLLLLFIAAGIGVLFRQNWGRKLFLGLGIYLIIQPLVSFLVFGFFTNTIWAAVELGFAGLILWYFHKRSIAFHFGSSEEELGRERWKHFAVAVFFILLLIGGYLFFVSSHGLDQVWQQEEVKKIDYSQFTFQPTENVSMISLLGRYQLSFPTRLQLVVSRENLSDSKEKNMLITNPDKSVALLVTDQPIFEAIAPVGNIFGYQDHFQFGQAFLKEKVGIIFLIIKKVMIASFVDTRFYQLSFQGWKGLLAKHKTSEGSIIYDYSLWKEKPLGIVVIVKNEAVGEKEVAAMITSLK